MLIENALFEFMSASGEHDGGCYPIVMPDNASFVQGLGFLDRNGDEVDLSNVEGKMDFKLTRDIGAAPIFSLTNGDGLTIGETEAVMTYVDKTGTEVTKTFTGKGIVYIFISYERAMMLSGKKGWCDLLLNFGDGMVYNVFPGGRPWVGCRSVSTIPFEPAPPEDDTPCEGPWKWFKFTIDPMEGNAYVRLIYLSMEPNADPYYDSSSVATLATGTPFASSVRDLDGHMNPPDGVFDVESGVPWVSESGDPSPWIAFRFNDPTEFSYLYIMTLVGTAEGYSEMTGGDVYVSNDSTDGVDGTWRLLRSGILDQSGIDNEVFLGVSLCTEDTVDIFSPDE